MGLSHGTLLNMQVSLLSFLKSHVFPSQFLRLLLLLLLLCHVSMWNTVARLLRGSGLDELPLQSQIGPTKAFQFVIFPTIKSLLLERAEAGDVQTIVCLCEVLQVIDSEGERTRIPNLNMKLVREWYFSYIDILHQMCLFTAAAFLIKNCNDKAIGALSQQSTT